MYKRRFIGFAFALLMFFSLTACSGGGTQSNLSGAPGEILGSLLSSMEAGGASMPAYTPPADVPPESAKNSVGLSAGDFERYAVAVSTSSAAIGTFAHQTAVIQAKDAKSALEIKKLIAAAPSDNPDESGYNPQKWICVMPEACSVVESGNYVFLIASSREAVEAGISAFEDAAGEIGEADVFYETA